MLRVRLSLFYMKHVPTFESLPYIIPPFGCMIVPNKGTVFLECHCCHRNIFFINNVMAKN